MKILILVFFSLISSFSVLIFNIFIQKNKKIIKLREEIEKIKIKQKREFLDSLYEYFKIVTLYSLVLIIFNTALLYILWLYLANLTVNLPKLIEVPWQYFYAFSCFIKSKILKNIIKI